MNSKGNVLVLSSRSTFFYRLRFIAYALISATALVVGLLSGDSSLLVVASGMALCSAISYSSGRGLKEIWVEGETVYASTWRRTITFPVSAIADIEARQFKPNRAFMCLKQRTAFGDCLVFLPCGFTSVRNNPVVKEVLARARTAPADQETAGTLSG